MFFCFSTLKRDGGREECFIGMRKSKGVSLIINGIATAPESETRGVTDSVCCRAWASLERGHPVVPLDSSLLLCGGESMLPDCEIFQEMLEYELYAVSRFLNAGS